MKKEPTILDLSRAVQFAFACIILVVSYFNICISRAIPAFGQVYDDLLRGAELPLLTQLALTNWWFFLVISILAPVIVIALLFFRRPILSIYLDGILVLISLAQVIFLFRAMTGPLMGIITGMNDQAG